MSLKDKIKGYIDDTKRLNSQYYVDQTYTTKEYITGEQALAARAQHLFQRENSLIRHESELLQWEGLLNEKEKQLEQDKETLEQKEAAVNEREQLLMTVAVEKAKKLIDAEHLNFERKVEGMEDYLRSLRSAESTIFNWLERMEDRERDVYDEIVANANKYKEHGKSLDGFKFESDMADILSNNGFSDVLVTQKSGDFGADITATKDEVKYVIQCKYYTSAVGIKAVQESYSAKDFYNAHVAIVATNNVFTKAAATLAEQLNVILWDCEDIARMKSV